MNATATFCDEGGMRLGFMAAQNARLPTVFDEDSGMSGLTPTYLVAVGGMAAMFYWAITRTYNISAWPSGSSRDRYHDRDRTDYSHGSSSSGSSLANLSGSENSSSKCSSDNSTPSDNSSSTCSSDNFSSSDDSSSSSDSSSDDSGGSDSDSDSGGSSDD
jgi:hypothetical protein